MIQKLLNVHQTPSQEEKPVSCHSTQLWGWKMTGAIVCIIKPWMNLDLFNPQSNIDILIVDRCTFIEYIL